MDADGMVCCCVGCTLLSAAPALVAVSMIDVSGSSSVPGNKLFEIYGNLAHVSQRGTVRLSSCSPHL
jgi:hypothetical protein